MPLSSDKPFPQKLGWALAVYILCFFAVYLALQLKYRVTNLDDTWEVSRAYYFLHQHFTGDPIDGSDDISSGVQYFRKGYTFLLGTALDLIGFTKPNSYWLSLLFIVGGLACWFPALRRLNYSRELAATFSVTGLLLDPFFSAATSSREEAFVFFMSSLAFLFFVRQNYFLAALAGWAALETHPTGALAFFLMGAAYLATSLKGQTHPLRSPKNLVFASAGFILGGLYFVWLHADVLNTQLPEKLIKSNQMGEHSVQNFLFEYFFHSKFNRHLAEFILLFLGFFEFLRKKMFKSDTFLIPLSIFLLVFSLVFQRPQFHYVLYFYPVFLLVLAKVFQARWGLAWLVWGILTLLLPQYAFAYHGNKAYDYYYEVGQYQKLIPADGLPVVGTPNAWFAFPGRKFYFNRYDGDFAKLGLARFYLVINDGFWGNPDDTARYIQAHYAAKPVGDFSMGIWKFYVIHEEWKGPHQP